MKSKIEELYNRNKKDIEALREQVGRDESSLAKAFAYSFVSSSFAQAVASGTTSFSVRYITDAVRSAAGAAAGTGLPAFYDENTSQWVDFNGVPITT